jgi:pilus assembly protein FimV
MAAVPADLGRLTVSSRVGEPLRAEIDVVGVRQGEAKSLAVRLGTPEEFWRVGLEPPAMLGALRASIGRGQNGRPVVTLASSAPIQEPFVSLLVQLSSSAGQSLREYPFLLEERHSQEARPVAPGLPGVAPPMPPEAAPNEPPGVPAGPTAVASGEGWHHVRPGETLAMVANAHRPPGATIDQMLVALYRANDGAFLDANMNRLPAGRVLAIPGEAAVLAVAADEARRTVAAHREAAEPPAAPSPQRAARVDRLQLSRADGARTPPGTGGADDVAALGLALKEAHERIAALERNLESLQRLGELQNRQITRLQHAAAGAAVPLPGDAAASDLRAPAPGVDEPYLQRAVARFIGEHWQWFATALILAFAAWVWMPLKTARLWRKKRRRRERDLYRAVRRERREGRDGRARRERRERRARSRAELLAPA